MNTERIGGGVADPTVIPLLLASATLIDGSRVDVRLAGASIEAVAAPGSLRTDRVETIDLAGYLLLPALVEPHAHLDKAYTADRAANPSGDLGGAIAAWLGYRSTMSVADIVARARVAVRSYLAHGTTALRTHVDVGGDLALRAIEAIVAVRESLRGECDLQIVAFTATPLAGPAGAQNRDLLRQALAAGADVVGACPVFDPDPAGCIATCLELAADHRAPVDLHIDEHLDPRVSTLSLLANAVSELGFPYGVVASHCVSLGVTEPARAAQIADRVAAAGIAVICLPQTNLYLQGRDAVVAPPRGLTAMRILRAAGVTVAAGGDNLQDPFNLLGRADPLETAALLVYAGHDQPEQAYAAVSAQARTALGLPAVGIAVGAPAELLAIRADTLRQAVAQGHPERVVIHAGRLVARTSMNREFPAARTFSGQHLPGQPQPDLGTTRRYP